MVISYSHTVYFVATFGEPSACVDSFVKSTGTRQTNIGTMGSTCIARCYNTIGTRTNVLSTCLGITGSSTSTHCSRCYMLTRTATGARRACVASFVKSTETRRTNVSTMGSTCFARCFEAIGTRTNVLSTNTIR